MEQVYRVEGMSCGGCASSVERAIQRADAQAEVAVDLAQSQVRVKSSLPEEGVREAVEGAGFTFVGRWQ